MDIDYWLFYWLFATGFDFLSRTDDLYLELRSEMMDGELLERMNWWSRLNVKIFSKSVIKNISYMDCLWLSYVGLTRVPCYWAFIGILTAARMGRPELLYLYCLILGALNSLLSSKILLCFCSCSELFCHACMNSWIPCFCIFAFGLNLNLYVLFLNI